MPNSMPTTAPPSGASQAWAITVDSTLSLGLPGSDSLAPSYGSSFDVVERNRAAYLQADFSGDSYRGNIGVRYVNTRDAIGGYQYDGSAYAPVRYNTS
jgi:iron complex outermembrane receptor protein